MTPADKVFSGCLVHLNVKGLLTPEQAKVAGARQLSEERLAEKLGQFLAPHFLKAVEQEDGSVLLNLNLTVMMAQAPKGVAHTKILFKEA